MGNIVHNFSYFKWEARKMFSEEDHQWKVLKDDVSLEIILFVKNDFIYDTQEIETI